MAKAGRTQGGHEAAARQERQAYRYRDMLIFEVMRLSLYGFTFPFGGWIKKECHSKRHSYVGIVSC